MRLLCINTNPILDRNGNNQQGWGLIKGNIYTTDGYVVKDSSGDCYFIEELNELKFCIRFKIISDDKSWVDELLEELGVLEEEVELEEELV